MAKNSSYSGLGDAVKRRLADEIPSLVPVFGLIASSAMALDAPVPPSIVRTSTSLITIPAEVVDRNGRYAGNLHKEDFRLYENGVEQELS